MGYKFNYGPHTWEIPDYMMPGLKAYVEDRAPPGSFLMAVLENDLSRAVGMADENNIGNLPAYASYLHNEMPYSCHGSPAKVKAWLAAGKEKETTDE